MATFDGAAPLTLADLLQAGDNPQRPWMPQVGAGAHGLPYMPPMPPRGPRGEMRSANEFPLSDLVAEQTGSPLAGVLLDKTARFGRNVGNAASGATMVPWAVETGKQLGETLATPSAQAGEGPSQLQQLMGQRESLNQQRATAVADRDAELRGKGGKSAGRGPNYDAKDKEVDRLTQEMSVLDQMIKPLLDQQSPEHQLKMETERQRIKEEKDKRAAELPWRERNPAWANALPNIGMTLAAGVPGGIAAMRNIRSFFPGSVQGQMRTAVTEAEAARASGNAPQAALRERELSHLLKEVPTWKDDLVSASKAALAGGALTAEAGMFPDQWDAYNLPKGSKNQAEAHSRAIDPTEYGKRGIMGALTGFSGYEGGANLTPWRGAPKARAQSLVDLPFSPVSPPPPPGHWNFQPRKNGAFAGAPKYPKGDPRND